MRFHAGVFAFVYALFLRFHAVDLCFKLCVLRFHAACVALSRFVCCVFTLRVVRFHACGAFSRLRFHAVLRHVVGHTLMIAFNIYHEMP